MTLYFVDAQGNYIGGFDGAAPPADSIEVPSAPDNAAQKWDGAQWLPAPPVPIPPTPRSWLERLSPATQAAISQAAVGNAQILLWLLKAAGNPSIDVTSAETQQGVAALVQAGILTPADQETLLAP